MINSKIQPKTISIDESHAFDRWTEEIGLSPLVLMENAGRAVAEAARKLLPRRKKWRVAIFAGAGNNGGDGFVAARYLYNWGIKVDIFLISGKECLKKEAKVNFKVLLNLKVNYSELDKSSVWQRVSKNLNNYDLIIDAILGTGLKKPVEGLLGEIIGVINRSGRPVVAVDIPSGMDGNTGTILGSAIKAKQTVTMAAPKKGFLSPLARAYLGEVTVAHLGINFKKVGG